MAMEAEQIMTEIITENRENWRTYFTNEVTHKGTALAIDTWCKEQWIVSE